MSPQRIQLRRTKGWRKPEGAVVVSRPSRWGNPFAVQECKSAPCRADRLPVRHWHIYDPGAGALSLSYPTREMAVATAVDWFHEGVFDNDGDRYEYLPRRDQIVSDLAGKDLACWCPLDQPCHADVLLELANGEAS
jgi:hypothetical protein